MRWRSNWFLGICFLAICACIFFALGPDFIAAARSYTWKPTPCEVLRLTVAEEQFSRTVTHFVLRVEYKYEYEGRPYHSTRFTTGEHQGSTDVAKAERAALRFASGTRATCYVNPRHPEEAVLERGELWGGIFFLAPFLILGLVMHESIFAWFEQRRWMQRKARNLPLSETNEALRADGRKILFGCLGSLMGLFLLGFCLVGPIWYWAHSRNWVPTAATITRSEIKEESGQHGPTYKLEVAYEYNFQGRRHRSDQRCFGFAIDEPVADLTAWAEAHPVGSSITCWVNPQDPTDAVLDRRPKIGWVPIALGSLMLGLGIYMFGSLWRTRWLRRNLFGPRLADYSLGVAMETPVKLQVTPSPWLKALGCGIGSLLLLPPAVWSLTAGFKALAHGQGDLINLLYGAGAGIGSVWLLLQCGKNIARGRQPRPILRITPGTPVVGKVMQVEWELPRSAEINSIRLWLEGAEEAKLRQLKQGPHGAISEEKTVRSVFANIPIHDQPNPAPSECVSFVLPPTLMHSFRGVKVGIVWQIKVAFGLSKGKSAEYGFTINLQPPGR